MYFQIDSKLNNEPWRIACIGQYTSVSEALNFLAWFRAQDSRLDYRTKRLRNKAEVRKAKHEINRRGL